jgi:uncharacterized protein YaaW (UPF0174 family)
MHKTAIFNNFLNESEVEEGSTWEGIKGFFRGKGYYYTKYLSQIQDVLERLQTKVVEDKKIQLELSKILDKVAASSMEDDKKNEVLNILVEIDNDLVSATKLLEDRMLQIENLKK